MIDILLNVSYEEKDEAKALGARWNPQLKSWYIPAGKDSQPFSHWLPTKSKEYELKAIPSVYLAKSITSCWSCDQTTDVYCLAAESYLDEQYEGDHSDEHEENIELIVTFSNLQSMDKVLLPIVEHYAKGYTIDYSRQASSMYYMNHCMHCQAKLGDFFLHDEPGGAFSPVEPRQGTDITLFHIPTIQTPVGVNASPGMQTPCFASLYATRKTLGST